MAKFDANGTRLWATYYGGTVGELGWSVCTDGDGNVFIAGIANSTTNIAFNGHQNSHGGGNDAFLAKFNATGVRQWATYYGGIETDWGRSICTDHAGNVYLAGLTSSITNISSDGFQNTYGGSYGDAFLAKFNPNGIRLWGTYYGGTSFDSGYSTSTDANGNVYLAGQTSSTTNIASGGFQNTYVGNRDAFLVKFADNQPPTAACQPITVDADDNCQVDVPASTFDNGSADPESAPLSFSVEPAGPYPLGATTATLTVSDGVLTDECTATITVEDHSKPKYNQGTPDVTLFTEDGADCPSAEDLISLVRDRDNPLTVGNVPVPYTVAGIPFLTPTDQISDNCTAAADIKVYVWNIQLDYDGNATDYYRQIRLVFRLVDEAGNFRNRDILYTLIDNTPPVIECAAGLTLAFNGEDYLAMDDFQEQLVPSAYDDCGDDDISFSFEPAEITCEQLGEVVDVLVTVCDGADPANCTHCVVPITVDGLPCGWMNEEGNIGCPDGSVDYDPITDSYFVNGGSCNSNPYDGGPDEFGFMQVHLCGNGEIIAHVTDIDGLGKAWAGIVMRNDNEPYSQKFQLLTGLNYLPHRVNWRSSSGGPNYTQTFTRPGQHWLRIVRTGSLFSAYVSYYGNYWGQPINTLFIPMPGDEEGCIQVGLVVSNWGFASNVTATFQNVYITGVTDNRPALPPVASPNNYPTIGLQAYPNPTNGLVTVDLTGYLEQSATLEVLNAFGQRLMEQPLGVIEQATQTLDLHDRPAGVYLIRLRLSNGEVEQVKVVRQ
ncbi:MAG: T9SS type A sorting domain-containing protein [Lewinella sp.]|nr:T9SS type A sorting domain-containing protein [Lewinella sp.]